eukprot:m.387837 g.387837  ORF g.387837 m.387837 type:complete len:620 (-) comp28286_c0_seq5:48-1907(-)
MPSLHLKGSCPAVLRKRPYLLDLTLDANPLNVHLAYRNICTMIFQCESKFSCAWQAVKSNYRSTRVASDAWATMPEWKVPAQAVGAALAGGLTMVWMYRAYTMCTGQVEQGRELGGGGRTQGTDSTDTAPRLAALSERGRRVVCGTLAPGDTPSTAPSYVLEHIRRLGSTEYTCLAIAENKLSFQHLRLTLAHVLLELGLAAQSADAGTADCTSGCGQTLGYADPAGSPRVRAAIATFLAREVARFDVDVGGHPDRGGGAGQRGDSVLAGLPASNADGSAPARSIDPDALVCSAGLAATTHMVLCALIDPGDGVLLPSPSYSGFDGNIRDARVGGVPIRLRPPSAADQFDDVDAVIAVDVLEKAVVGALASGIPKVSVLLISSPSNPTGKLHSPAALKAAVRWAERRGIHTVFDEVYAGSVHRKGAAHCSALSLFASDDCGFVHTLYGFAKDFGLAGWRVGVLHSRNTAVVSAVRAMAHQCEASTLTLGVIERILCNTDAVADYLRAHRRTLRVACAEVTSALRTANIAYFEPDAGVFIVVDLRPFLLDQSFATETRLYHALLDRAGVNLTPGQSMNCAVPGFFRICFAYNSASVTRGAVASVIAVLEYLRMEHKYIDM